MFIADFYYWALYIIFIPGRVWPDLKGSWGALGAVLGCSWALLGRTWGALGRSWELKGLKRAILEPERAILEPQAFCPPHPPPTPQDVDFQGPGPNTTRAATKDLKIPRV